MNIFRTYVRRNLKNNRLRTVMTIMGIILSVALVTAVIEGAFSGVEYIRNVLKDTYGNHHGYALNMTMDTAYELIQRDELEGYAGFNTLGWAEIGSQNSTKPYLLIKEASENITDFLNVKVIEGRFPENENEILLPAHLATNGNVQYKIGDTFTVVLSARFLSEDGSSSADYDIIDNLMNEDLKDLPNGFLPENIKYTTGERLLSEKDGYEVQKRTYTVCGIMERLPYTIEEYMCPGYTAIVKNTAVSPKYYNGLEIPDYNLFFRVKDPTVYNEFHNGFEKEHPDAKLVKNRELVALYGGINDRSITFFISGFVVVLIALILFGSISLVYNSFSISINERTKQIGILKSVGATKKQIRKTIFYEALFDCIISIPLGIALGCLGIGLTLFLLQEGFATFLDYFSGFNADGVKIQLVINIPLLIISILIVIVAVILSAAIPAIRASKISPIDLVRQNADIKATGKIRKSRILSRIFGAEGMLASKNYSRNKKRYRSTIVSLSVSIVLFIAASSFCAYLNSATQSEVYSGNVDLVYYYYDIPDYMEADSEEKSEAVISKKEYPEIKEMLRSAMDVDRVIVANNLFDYSIHDPYAMEGLSEDDEFIEEPAYKNEGSIYFIDDESFLELLKSEGIENVGQSDTVWNAVVFNSGTFYSFDAEDNRIQKKYKFVEEDELPKKLNVKWYNEYNIDDLIPIDQVIDGDGEVYTVYLKSDYVNGFYNLIDSEETWMMVEEAIHNEFKKYLESNGKDTQNLNREDYETYSIDLEENAGEAADNTVKNDNDEESGNSIKKINPLTEPELALISKCTFAKREDICENYNLNIIGVTYNEDFALSTDATILLPFSAIPEKIKHALMDPEYYIFSSNAQSSEESINKLLLENNMDTGGLYNVDSANAGKRMIGKIVSVFSYGFILLISLVAIANVFNTISTNVHLRRREFGMLKSMGLSNKGVSKILNIECLIYGSWSLLIGLTLSVPITWCIYKITNRAFSVTFSIPWYSVVIAVAAVFFVVFVTMLYASGKIKNDNTLDAIRADNI